MTRVWVWRTLVVGIATLLAGLLALLQGHTHLKTDVFSLLTETQSTPGAALVGNLIDQQSRVLAIRVDGADASARATHLADDLRANPAIKRAAAMGLDALAPAATTLRDERMVLLFPRLWADAHGRWQASGQSLGFAEWWAQERVEALDHFLMQPEALAMSELVVSDPLLLLPGALAESGWMGSASSASTAVILAETKGPATDHDIQMAVLAWQAQAQTEAAKAGLQVHLTGAPVFAESSERLIKADVVRLNSLITLLLLGLSLVVLRSLRAMAALSLPVLMAGLGAAVVLFARYDAVYALALGIGGILGGVAIDYPVHLYLHRREGETSFLPALRRVAWPLVLGGLSSVAVLWCLILSHLEMLRQVGILVGCGLMLCLLFAWPCLEAFAPRRPIARLQQRLEFSLPTAPRWLPPALAVGLLVLSLGSLRLRSGDAVEALQVPLPALWAEAALVRQADPTATGARYALATGGNYSEALEQAEAGDGLSHGFAACLPTPGMLEAAVAWQAAEGAAFQDAFSRQLEVAGFTADAFDPLFTDFPAPGAARPRLEHAMEHLASTLPPGMGWMLGQSEAGAWIVCSLPPDQTGLDHRLLPLDTRAVLREAFRRYRLETLRLAAWGGLGVGALILILRGPREGLRVLRIPLLALAACLGGLGWSGYALHLFHVVGLLLGFGLAIDYALFTVSGGQGRGSVRLSALTTLGAFGVLATSGIPAVRDLGLSVFLLVLLTLIQCELHRPADERPAR